MEAKKISDGELLLLKEYRRGDELALRKLIQRYERLVFSLVLYLASCDRDRAFSVTAFCFVRAMRSLDSVRREGDFLEKLLRLALEECRSIPRAPKFDLSDFENRPPHKKEALRVMKQALASLSFDHKKLILLRDQFHLAYQDIASVSGLSEKETKIQTIHARVQLQDKVKEIMEPPEAAL